MDDIKLYARSGQDTNSLIHPTRHYSHNTGMSFRLHKCDRMTSKRGKVISTEGTELPEGNIVDDQGSYKYLGVPQVNG